MVPSTSPASPTTTPNPFSRICSRTSPTVASGLSTNGRASAMALPPDGCARVGQLEDPRRQLVGGVRASHAPPRRSHGGPAVAIDEQLVEHGPDPVGG